MIVRAWLVLSFCITISTYAQNVIIPEEHFSLSNSCDSNISRIFAAHIEAGKDGLIIVIARLGRNETSRSLNHRRLHNFKTFLTKVHGRDPMTIVTAEGKPSQTRGRIEIYVSGKLWDVFGVGRGEDLYVGFCDGTVKEEIKLFFDSRRNKSR